MVERVEGGEESAHPLDPADAHGDSHGEESDEAKDAEDDWASQEDDEPEGAHKFVQQKLHHKTERHGRQIEREEVETKVVQISAEVIF